MIEVVVHTPNHTMLVKYTSDEELPAALEQLREANMLPDGMSYLPPITRQHASCLCKIQDGYIGFQK